MTVATIERTTPDTAGANTISPIQSEWTSDQLAMLHAIGVEDETPSAELKVFLQQCQRTGLDPFAKQVYLIGRYDKRARRRKYTIQTGIDGFRVIAHRSNLYAGQTEPQWCGPDGVWRDVWPERQVPVAARVGVYRQGFAAPLYAVAHFTEYAPTDNDGGLTGLWRQMPRLMISKVAEALALRKTFPQDLSGLYIAEEMDQADGTRVYNISPEPARTEPAEQASAAVEPSQPSVEEYRAKVRDRIAKATGDVDKLQTLHGWASDASRYDETAVQEIEVAIHEARAAEPTQQTTDTEEPEPAADEVTSGSTVDAEVVAEPTAEDFAGHPVRDWEGWIEDAEKDGDLETLDIHVQTLEAQPGGKNHRLTKIARVARKKVRDAQK